MDVQMPEMDGYDATMQIRMLENESGSDKHIRIIAMTANTQESDRERCLAVGMDNFVSKPFRMDDLLQAMSDL
jgi:CheY-like chemotaxis protein